MEDMILYHGSKGGIDGKIEPISRVRCDFGKGFYMGDNFEQAKGIVCNDDAPYCYKLKFKLSQIPEDRILVIDDDKWLKVVLSNRKSIDEFNHLKLAKKTLKQLEKYDVIIGKIADDSMREAFDRFADYSLTDNGLYNCLTKVKYGNQIVAKTQTACDLIEIIEEKKLKGFELEEAQKYAVQKRTEAKNIVNENIIKYRGNGKYLDEIIKIQKKKELNQNKER